MEYWTQFVPAPVGWYVWYHNNAVPGPQGHIRRVIAGWAVHTTRTAVPSNTPGPNFIDVITSITPLTYSRRLSSLAPAVPAFSGFTYLGIEWPSMTSQERSVMLSTARETSYPHVPTLPNG